MPKPTVITRNAMPKLVFSANGWRSPYGRSAIGSCRAFDARSTNAAMPTSIDEERRDDADQVEAPLEAPGDSGPRRDEQADDERPDQQGERGEERPASEIVAPGRPRGTHGLGRRRCSHADPEREDPGRGVPVVADHAPAHRVAMPHASRETGATTT